jgi:hypothetical protein
MPSRLPVKRICPRLDSQSDDEYAAYKTRASFFNASACIADGYVGLIFRREPSLKVPDASAGIGRVLDVDMFGTSLLAYPIAVSNCCNCPSSTVVRCTSKIKEFLHRTAGSKSALVHILVHDFSLKTKGLLYRAKLKK